jgi:hypothetical protein
MKCSPRPYISLGGPKLVGLGAWGGEGGEGKLEKRAYASWGGGGGLARPKLYFCSEARSDI